MQTVAENGRPPAGTKIIIVRTSSSRHKPGDVAYVANRQSSVQDHELCIGVSVANLEPDAYVTGWDFPSPLDTISDEAKQALTDKALAAAKNRGYCDQTKKILADLGLPTEATPVTEKVTVEIEYTVKDGYSFVASNLVYDDWTKGGTPVIKIVKAVKK